MDRIESREIVHLREGRDRLRRELKDCKAQITRLKNERERRYAFDLSVMTGINSFKAPKKGGGE